MLRKHLILLAGIGSFAILSGAFAFQYLGGLLPCVLCIYQRWPHALAIVAALFGLKFKTPVWLWLGALAAATTAAIGVFHAGVELGAWEGLATCTVDTLKGLNAGDLLNMDSNIGAPVRCDAVPWSLFGISMAGWNAILSIILTFIWIAAARKTDTAKVAAVKD